MKTRSETDLGIVTRLLASLVLSLAVLISLVGCDTGASSSDDKVRLVITPVDTPTPTPLAAPTMAPTTYTVRAGDTLSGVADLFGVSVDDIVRANNIADPNSLSEGQVLTIPVRSAPPGPGTPGKTPTGVASPGPSVSPTVPLPPPNITPPLGPTAVE